MVRATMIFPPYPLFLRCNRLRFQLYPRIVRVLTISHFADEIEAIHLQISLVRYTEHLSSELRCPWRALKLAVVELRHYLAGQRPAGYLRKHNHAYHSLPENY